MRNLFTFLLVASVYFSFAQISITSSNFSNTQNFNSLITNGTSSTLPPGWSFLESGSNANTVYSAGSGTATAGDTYAYGSTGNSDRALGELTSGSLQSRFGVYYVNNCGAINYQSINVRLYRRIMYSALGQNALWICDNLAFAVLPFATTWYRFGVNPDLHFVSTIFSGMRGI